VVDALRYVKGCRCTCREPGSGKSCFICN